MKISTAYLSSKLIFKPKLNISTSCFAFSLSF